MLVLLISLVWVLEASAARCSRCRSLCLEEILKGVGNVSKNETFSVMNLNIKMISVKSWQNPADNQGGEPSDKTFSFNSSVGLQISEQVDEQAVKNGKAIIDLYVPDCVIYDFLFCANDLQYFELDQNGDPIPICVQYGCLEWDKKDPELCLEEGCLTVGGVCPGPEDDDKKFVAYDFSGIDGFQANDKWGPEPPSCDPDTYPNGSEDNDGEIIIERLWIESIKTVEGVPEPVDAACYILEGEEGSFDDNRVNYNKYYIPEDTENGVLGCADYVVVP